MVNLLKIAFDIYNIVSEPRPIAFQTIFVDLLKMYDNFPVTLYKTQRSSTIVILEVPFAETAQYRVFNNYLINLCSKIVRNGHVYIY